MLKVEEIRNKSTEELDSALETLKSEVYELRSQRLDSKSQKIHLTRQKRREIARILTVKRERELQV